MKQNGTIKLERIQYREEDFGFLLKTNSNGRFHVINNTGIELIEIIKELGECDFKELISLYLEKYKFDNKSEYDNAFETCSQYIEDLTLRKVIKII